MPDPIPADADGAPATARADALVRHAMAVVEREGPANLTMRRVADEAGITATALYRHFADKDALVAVLVRQVYALFRRSLISQMPARNPEAWLRIACDRFLRFALERPNFYRLLFLEPRDFAVDRYPEDFRAGKSAGFRQLRDIVGECMGSGMLAGEPARDAPDVALTLYAHMHGLIALHLAGRFPDADVFERFYWESIERLLEGIRRRDVAPGA